jgi:hypothetical protein
MFGAAIPVSRTKRAAHQPRQGRRNPLHHAPARQAVPLSWTEQGSVGTRDLGRHSSGATAACRRLTAQHAPACISAFRNAKRGADAVAGILFQEVPRLLVKALRRLARKRSSECAAYSHIRVCGEASLTNSGCPYFTQRMLARRRGAQPWGIKEPTSSLIASWGTWLRPA